MKKKVVVVDDHILIAKAIKGIIDGFNNYEVIYVCENGQELINKFEQNHSVPDIILLDVSMPVMDGFQTVKWVKDHKPDIKVMALSMQGDDDSVIKMVRNGAVGYLLKNVHPSDLEKALDKLVNDGFYYPDWASKLLFSKMTQHDEEQSMLSKREIEFLKYVASDLSYKEIADKMHCSPRTVEGYRSHLCEKLDIKSRVGLAVFAIKNGYSE